jgi:hypothetical protein
MTRGETAVTSPQRPLDALKNAADRVKAQRDAARESAQRIADERAATLAPPQEPVTPPEGP